MTDAAVGAPPPLTPLPSGNADYAIVGARLLDPGGDQWREGLAIRISEGRIAGVGPETDLPAERLLPRLRATNCHLLPGLIDVHVHSEDWQAPLYLACGVTAVRDVGCSLADVMARRERWNRRDGESPRLICTGPLLDGDRQKGWTGMAEFVTSPAEAREQVDRLVDAGVDQIKLYAALDRLCSLAVIERAQRHGRFTVAHLQDHMTAVEAARAGVDEIEHLSGIAEAIWPERHAAGEHWLDLWPDLEPQRVAAVLDEIVARGTWLAPTQVVWQRIAEAPAPRLRRHRQFAHAPADLRRWWQQLYDQPTEQRERLRRSRALAGMQVVTAHLAERRVLLLAGSDAPFCHVMPGFGLLDELQLLAACGVPAADCIRAATSSAARALQIEDRVGRIAPGLDADLLILRDEPLADLDAIMEPLVVIRAGHPLQPAALLARARSWGSPRPAGRISADY